MTNTVEFPNLSLVFENSRVAFSVGGLEVYWYGVIVTFGIILAIIYSTYRAAQFGNDPDRLFDVAFIGIVGALIGARLYFVIFSEKSYTIITTFTDFRNGGLAVYGGVIGGMLSALIYCRVKKMPFFPVMDIAGIALLLGQGIGRWGNFFNQEAFGAPTAGELPWGMTGNIIAAQPEVSAAIMDSAFSGGGAVLVHPCFLYESVWCLIGFAVLHFFSKKFRSFDGEMILLYMMWYGTGRAVIEGFRTDSLYIGNFRVSQVLSAVLALAGLVGIIIMKRKCTASTGYVKFSDRPETIAELERVSDEITLTEEKRSAVKALRRKTKELKQFAPADSDDEYVSIIE
ncbi:prolipoprotein diacylglyceryl transferase [Clostridia bacterium]|nr:prolipoprotein diacylglyceryl transferase [Clostridia bacterium]